MTKKMLRMLWMKNPRPNYEGTPFAFLKIPFMLSQNFIFGVIRRNKSGLADMIGDARNVSCSAMPEGILFSPFWIYFSPITL